MDVHSCQFRIEAAIFWLISFKILIQNYISLKKIHLNNILWCLHKEEGFY